MGAAGKRTPQMWAMYITTSCFWIGIGHAGTRSRPSSTCSGARWRTSIYRGAEAMTVFAVMTAGLFPLIHAGRDVVRLLAPATRTSATSGRTSARRSCGDVVRDLDVPHDQRGVLHRGLFPDVAALRDGSTGFKRKIYRCGARLEGSDSQWRHYRPAIRLSRRSGDAARALVHSVVRGTSRWPSSRVALDAVRPVLRRRRHLLGFAMVLVAVIPMRHFFHLHPYITDRHSTPWRS